MAEVICDTSFVMHIASDRIKNMGSLNTEIGDIVFVVPSVVRSELRGLCADYSKANAAKRGLEFASKAPDLEMGRGEADGAIAEYVGKNGGIVATMDAGLKDMVRQAGGSVMSISSDRIVLEGKA